MRNTMRARAMAEAPPHARTDFDIYVDTTHLPDLDVEELWKIARREVVWLSDDDRIFFVAPGTDRIVKEAVLHVIRNVRTSAVDRLLEELVEAMCRAKTNNVPARSVR
tara:strand:- start:1262 stop:1585 length:324 start_codon:yes stop_codon:yes gene_type:complete